MTDEEKKAIDKLKTLIQYLSVWKENFTIVPEDVKYLIPILNLIEKQSNEIEELKKYEEGYKLLSYSLDNYISKDKIKAKIEPVLKQLERKMEEEYNKYGNSREYQDIVDAYNFLQSLLEKE